MSYTLMLSMNLMKDEPELQTIEAEYVLIKFKDQEDLVAGSADVPWKALDLVRQIIRQAQERGFEVKTDFGIKETPSEF